MFILTKFLAASNYYRETRLIPTYRIQFTRQLTSWLKVHVRSGLRILAVEGRFPELPGFHQGQQGLTVAKNRTPRTALERPPPRLQEPGLLRRKLRGGKHGVIPCTRRIPPRSRLL